MSAEFPAIATCLRCAAPCIVNPARDERARLLRHATEPVGYCADCALTQFLKATPLGGLLEAGGVARLLEPQYQEQVARLLVIGHADADPAEISWSHVVETWALPFPAPRRRKKGRAPS